MKIYDLIIIGAGPAGLSAAVYASRAALDYVVIESAPVGGGQVITTSEVDNYPGFSQISGWELGMKFKEHAAAVGAVFETKTAAAVTKEEEQWQVSCEDGSVYRTRAIIAAMGAKPRELSVPGEAQYKGKGVSYCATCDGNFFKGKKVAVVGGGDTAMEDAAYLSRICEKVYIIHRRDTFRAAGRMVERINGLSNVELLMETRVESIEGELQVRYLVLDCKGEKRELSIDGVFVAAGVIPDSRLLQGLVEMDEAGYALSGENCVTNCKGIFVAGDIRKKPLRQIVTAAADGANAVASVVGYLQ